MPQLAEYRGGFWLFLSEVALAVLGAAYWFILSRLVGATELGIAAAIVSVGSLVAALTSLGVETGLFRHAGEMFKRGDKTSASTYLWSSVVIRIPMFAVAVFIVTQLPAPDPLYSATLAVVVGLVGILNIYTAAMYRTEVRLVVNVVSSFVKIGVGVMLAGWGWLGVVISYISGSIVSLVMFAGFVLRQVVFTKPRIGASIEVVKAGVPLWVSSASMLTAQLAGVLSVYVISGAAETGVLYVAQVVSSLVIAAAGISVGLLTPALAAMDSGRREAAASACRLALALSAPLAAMLVAMPYVPLSLLGREFQAAALPLALLAAAAVPTVVLNVVNSYYLAEKRYKSLFLINFLRSVLQIVLYIFLIPLYGAVGAALSAFVATLVFAAALSKFLDLGRLHLLAVAVPFATAPAGLVLPWPLAAAAISASWLLYLRVGVLTRRDISDLAHAILGKQADNIYRKYWYIIDKIIPER
ncbi:MAG: hypothetical protein QXD96_08825 [Pyrobaculum sp.]